MQADINNHVTALAFKEEIIKTYKISIDELKQENK